MSVYILFPHSESSFRRKPGPSLLDGARLASGRRLDAPVSSTGQAPQVRHDGKGCLWTDSNYIRHGGHPDRQMSESLGLVLNEPNLLIPVLQSVCPAMIP